MIAETTAYRLLSNDKTLNELFDQFRGVPFGNGFKQGIFTYDIPGFGTIRNNTALKRICGVFTLRYCFGTIRNNTALKQEDDKPLLMTCFGTIRNNTALKRFTCVMN